MQGFFCHVYIILPEILTQRLKNRSIYTPLHIMNKSTIIVGEVHEEGFMIACSNPLCNIE